MHKSTKGSKDTSQGRSRTLIHDALHLVLTLGSVLLWRWLPREVDCASEAPVKLITVVSVVRIWDMFWDFQMLAVFGNAYGAAWVGAMRRRRIQRTVILQILLFTQLVFWFAIMWWGLKLLGHDLLIPLHDHLGIQGIICKGDALQLAFCTPTTIGYGSPAPRTEVAVVACMVQFVMALLLVTGLIGSFLARTSVGDGKGSGEASGKVTEEDRGRVTGKVMEKVMEKVTERSSREGNEIGALEGSGTVTEKVTEKVMEKMTEKVTQRSNRESNEMGAEQGDAITTDVVWFESRASLLIRAVLVQ